ncbi:Gp37-like protein [Rothia sp. P5764]|uniref:Gp37-like protein n=1 Tax=Rothia sp. P5764 TaxID=3402654 RepID=UPI003AC21CCB
MLSLWALDPTGVPRGLLEPLTAKAVTRYNNLTTFLFELGLDDDLVRRLSPGWSVMATDGPLHFSGAIREFVTQVDGSGGTLTISGRCELHRLADRVVYPDPTKEPGAQGRARYDLRGPAETIIKTLVNLNAGPAALSARRSPALVVAESRGLGGNTSCSERFSSLLEACQKVANPAGLRFIATRNDERQIVFDVEPTRDLTRQVRLVASGDVKNAAPTGNVVIVGGQGEGADRKLKEYTSAPGTWGHRIETFKDRRDTNDDTDLDKAGAEALAEAGPRNSASFTLEEDDGTTFGIDFDLGDTITLEVGPVEYTEQVTSAEITWTGTGRTVKLGVGPDAENIPAWSPRVNDLAGRLQRLEAQ